MCFCVILVSIDVLYDHLNFEVAEYGTVFGIYAVLVLAPVMSAFINNFLAPHRVFEIIDSIDCVLLNSGIDLSRINTEHKFFKVINRNIAQTLCSFGILVASRYINRPFYTTSNLNIVVMILYFYKHYVILQSVYLIELSKLCLALLSTRMLEYGQIKKMNQHQMIMALSKLKLMHLDVWEIIHRINSHFGWTFIAMFFEAFINASRATYLLIICFYDFEESRHTVLRKYDCFNSSFF